MRPIRSLTATLYNRPRAWARTATRISDDGRVHRHNPRGYADWKSEVAAKLAALASYRTFTGEVAVRIDLYADRIDVQIHQLDINDARRKPTGLTGDVDNYAKAVLDALQTAKVLTDDRAVSLLEVRFRP